MVSKGINKCNNNCNGNDCNRRPVASIGASKRKFWEYLPVIISKTTLHLDVQYDVDANPYTNRIVISRGTRSS
jgi:hypothetical protein